MITKEQIKEYLHYDPGTGEFTWVNLPARSRKAVGEVAGCDMRGYVGIWLYGKLWKAHRLAWVYMTGEYPQGYIDHINGIPNDNRFENLREATNLENQRNSKMNASNTSGTRGLVWHKRDKNWQVSLRVDGRQKFIGTFKDKELAELVAEEAREKYHGDFYRKYEE